MSQTTLCKNRSTNLGMNNEDPISILPQIKHVNTKLIHLLIMLNTNGKKPCHVLKWCHTFATLFM